MRTKSEAIEAIVAALNAYSEIQAPAIVTSTLEAMDDTSIGVLWGICGVFKRAVCGKPKMPVRWQKQIHENLLDAFSALSGIAHEERKTP